tara:strand:- start:154 stop:387 length:234 start_codon:yes stop_codon:yes gene_type:complete
MIIEYLVMNGYGIYVWPAFLFTMFSFATLYAIIKSQLVREQKRFEYKFNKLNVSKSSVATNQKLLKEILDNTAASKI